MTNFKRAVAGLLVSATCALMPVHAGAQTMTDHPTIQKETTLSLSGEGKVSTNPDIAFISLGVNVISPTAAEAMSQQARLMNGVVNEIKKAGVLEKDMQTGNISLNPQYNWSSRNDGKPPKLTGYQATNTLNVTVRDLEDLGDVLDKSVSTGGNTINSVSFGVDDPSDMIQQARTAAVADALEKADLYAKAAGYTVARIITLSEGYVSGPQPQMMAMARSDMAEMASVSTPVEAGEIDFTAQINVVFELTR